MGGFPSQSDAYATLPTERPVQFQNAELNRRPSECGIPLPHQLKSRTGTG